MKADCCTHQARGFLWSLFHSLNVDNINVDGRRETVGMVWISGLLTCPEGLIFLLLTWAVAGLSWWCSIPVFTRGGKSSFQNLDWKYTDSSPFFKITNTRKGKERKSTIIITVLKINICRISWTWVRKTVFLYLALDRLRPGSRMNSSFGIEALFCWE